MSSSCPLLFDFGIVLALAEPQCLFENFNGGFCTIRVFCPSEPSLVFFKPFSDFYVIMSPLSPPPRLAFKS